VLRGRSVTSSASEQLICFAVEKFGLGRNSSVASPTFR
jgi:hypothetical protein